MGTLWGDLYGKAFVDYFGYLGFTVWGMNPRVCMGHIFLPLHLLIGLLSTVYEIEKLFAGGWTVSFTNPPAKPSNSENQVFLSTDIA